MQQRCQKDNSKNRQAYSQKLTRGCDWMPVKRQDKYRIHEHSAWFDSDFSLKTLYLQTIQSIWTAFLYDSAQIKNVSCYKTWSSCNLSWWVAVPRTLIASQKSAMHQLIEENVSGPTTFLDVWDILDNCARRIANGPFTSFTFEMASLAAKVVQGRFLLWNRMNSWKHIFCVITTNRCLPRRSNFLLNITNHHVIYLKQLEAGWHGEPRLRRLRSISIAPPTRH